MLSPQKATLELAPEGFRQSEPVAHLYVHVPFCAARCTYCDFVFFVGREGRMNAYLESLEWELDAAARSLWLEPQRTLHLGGGTPSLLPPAAIARIIATVRAGWGLVPSAEIAIEANPSTTDRERAEAWLEAGVNRVSLGVQCFDDALLRSLGRRHGGDGARASFAALRAAGCPNVSLDLIYGIPGMDLALWRETVLRAIDLGPDHISCYCLTLEEGTPLERRVAEGKVTMPDEDQQLEQLHLAVELLRQAGYRRYEVSNWARADHESAHNLTYWRGQAYYGAGCGAHSLLPLVGPAGEPAAVRFWNTAGLEHYIGSSPWVRDGEEILTGDSLAGDFMMVNLRLAAGVPEFPSPRLGGQTPGQRFGHRLSQLVAAGVLQETVDGWGPTPRGMDLHNAIAREFLPE